MSGRPTDANRHRMLAKVKRDWIDGYLRHSLDNLARIELGLEEKPDAVSRPWDLIVQQPDQAPRPLPPSQAMGAIFDELGQALLILGAPGTGKTTLLLELARDLLDRAVEDATRPIPIVFHLSSWAARRCPLVDWLVDELTKRYYVPRKLAQAWTDAEQVLPLLDGLDEVAAEHREACVEAINAFRRGHERVPLAVCSRAAEYEELRVRMAASGAVMIQPLSRSQIGDYLKQAGKPLAGVRTALRDDETLWELLKTPLMLSIVALAYQGRSAAEVRATGSLEQRRTHLFENYTESMFRRRSKVTAYTREQTFHWLIWLARSLIQNNLSIFYVEWMQPDWLPSRAQRWLLAIGTGMFCGLVVDGVYELGYRLTGELSELIGGRVFVSIGWPVRLALGLGIALVIGHYLGRLNRITPAEALLWSGKKIMSSVRMALILGFVLWLVMAVLWLLTKDIDDTTLALMLSTLVGALGAVLPFGLIYGLAVGVTVGQIATRTTPNEGIQRSLRNAMISFLSMSLVGGLIIGLIFGLISAVDAAALLDKDLRGLVLVFSLGLSDGLRWTLPYGVCFGLVNGGIAYVQHHILRILLRRNNFAPWNYIRFLDYAVERVFLSKVGGGYIFTHRLLMEYFATLQPTDQARQG